MHTSQNVFGSLSFVRYKDNIFLSVLLINDPKGGLALAKTLDYLQCFYCFKNEPFDHFQNQTYFF